ncbi:MAG: hypothetical protein OEM15_09745 [Myxococcales bacterium]|nr:hypothetical protein [Myxococcales bacterium]MDH3483079.1 hypothetical protein [Myxococcales bacterium]
MLACVDVDYQGDEGPAIASCVVYKDWDSSESHEERFAFILRVAPYAPGQFHERELPCILHRALNEEIHVIGIAKNPFGDFHGQRRVLRGRSHKPLFVTAAGMDVDVAAESVRRMNGGPISLQRKSYWTP